MMHSIAKLYIGQHVLYVPAHAKAELSHKDVEKGIVTGFSSQKDGGWIFVRFGGDVQSKACRVEDLA